MKNNQVIIRTSFFDSSHSKRSWVSSNRLSDHSKLKANQIIKKDSFNSSIDYAARKTECTLENKKEFGSYAEYMNQSYKVTSEGHFTKEKTLTNNEFLKEAKDKPEIWKVKDESLVWSTIISFTNDFTNENDINSKEAAADLVRNTIDKFFEENKIDPDSMEYLGQFHVDTPHHFHIHLRVHQKEPGTLNRSNGKTEWRTKGKFSKASLKRWRTNIEEYATEKTIRKTLNYRNVSKLRDQLKTRTVDTFDNIKNRDEVISLSKRIKNRIGQKGRFQYGAIKDQVITKPLIDKLVNLVIDSSPEAREVWKNIRTKIDGQMDSLSEKLNKKKPSHKKMIEIIEQKRIDKHQEVWKHLANQILKKVKNNNWDKELGVKERKIPITPRVQYKKRNKAINNFASKAFWKKLEMEETRTLDNIAGDIVSMIEKEKAKIEAEEGVTYG